MMLTEFLLARIAEDEAVARAAIDPNRPGTHWQWVDSADDTPSTPSGEFLGQEYMTDPASLRTVEEFPTTSGVGDLPSFAISHVEELRSGPALHIARRDPARVLAECEAKRQIIAWASDGEGEFHWSTVLAPLAAVYADHPDYDGAWRP